MTGPNDPEELAGLQSFIEAWLNEQERDNPAVLAFESNVEGPRSWFVRMQGEEKDVFTIRFGLRQRTLHYETHFMPAPEENQGRLFEHLLRRNAKLYGAAFTVGEEDAIYLQGQLDNTMITVEGELDRVLGSMYVWVEQFFRPALKLGFASRFT